MVALRSFFAGLLHPFTVGMPCLFKEEIPVARCTAEDVDAPPDQPPDAQQPSILQWISNEDVFPLSISIFLMLVLCTAVCECICLPVANALAIFLLSSDHQGSADAWPWVRAVFDHVSQALWLMPALVLTKVMSCWSFQELADIAHRVDPRVPRTTMPSLKDMQADAQFGVTVPTLFLLQSHLLSILAPHLLGSVISTLHLSLLYSLSAFEYIWFSRGWEPHRRVLFVEDNWTYFIGFGMPLTLVTSLSSSFCIRRILFSMAFPLFFLTSLVATPRNGPLNFPLKLFTPAVWVSDAIHWFVSAVLPSYPRQLWD